MATPDTTTGVPIRSSADLWGILQTQGGLQADTYDRELVETLIQGLSLDIDRPIADQLGSVSTTRFMVALFAALQPWDRMMGDVLDLFGRHGVKTSNGEVLIEFEFGPNESLTFDADQFKQARAAAQKLGAAIQDVETGDLALFELARAMAAQLAASHGLAYDTKGFFRQTVARIGGVEQHDNRPPDSQDARFWLGFLPQGEDRVHERWPFDEPPPFPAWAANDPLGPVVQPVETAISILSARVAGYASWQEIGETRRRETPDPAVNTDQRAALTAWTLNRVLAAQHDRLALSLLHRLWLLHDLAPSNAVARAALAAAVAKDVALALRPIVGSSPQQALEELLALPLWQYRHQLYSVWLVTAVEGALPDRARMTLQPVDGRLRFAFSATLVATIATDGPTFSLVAEHKTEAPEEVTLLGKSRVSAIQPDYVIRNDDAGTVAYVLEAKQYRKGKKGEFARAVHDYAAVHAHALVALANYGTMPAGMTEAIDTATRAAGTRGDGKLSDRCLAIGDVKPEGAGLPLLRAHLSAIFAPSVAVVMDGTASMLHVVPVDELPPLWALLNGWHGPLALAFSSHEALLLVPPARDRDLRTVLREHAHEAPLSVEQAASQFEKPRILVTDQGGWQESRAMHGLFSAVIVLRDAEGRFDLIISADSPKEIEPFFRAQCETAARG
ncbi:hypothetical protein [Mitsuaria sp. GD03876]|uniref:hypothetical protein n=1 Tax=Mitsuaria sp. GD03876 TaxID=2975399 RepID=UPI002447924B|nr:hypothetical protein [Mitsuaria sp. GD03876]MDH0866405.1 hypothetical protein [Mitsuaria sp. GD03876]